MKPFCADGVALCGTLCARGGGSGAFWSGNELNGLYVLSNLINFYFYIRWRRTCAFFSAFTFENESTVMRLL